jgi:hypothetical protein
VDAALDAMLMNRSALGILSMMLLPSVPTPALDRSIVVDQASRSIKYSRIELLTSSVVDVMPKVS